MTDRQSQRSPLQRSERLKAWSDRESESQGWRAREGRNGTEMTAMVAALLASEYRFFESSTRASTVNQTLPELNLSRTRRSARKHLDRGRQRSLCSLHGLARFHVVLEVKSCRSKVSSRAALNAVAPVEGRDWTHR